MKKNKTKQQLMFMWKIRGQTLVQCLQSDTKTGIFNLMYGKQIFLFKMSS